MDSSTNFSEVERSIVEFIVLGIVCGIVTQYIFEKFSIPVPYHVAVFLEGGAIAVAIKANSSQTIFEQVIGEPSVSSTVILYGLLPSLLFKETMNLNWHHVTSGWTQYMLLAGPGAFITALAIGLLSRAILSPAYDWPWQICFLFGSILSSTDPVSIVTLLNTLGASTKLTTVIVGEALFNDGSAFLLYSYFYYQRTYENYPYQLIAFVFRTILASPAIGAFLGLITHKLMRYLSSPVESYIDIQIVITITCAYVSFYIAEGPCEASGVLSCCAAGLMMAYVGSPKLLGDNKMRTVWENLEWLCNTLIFFIAGLICGTKGLSATTGNLGIDFSLAFVMYVVVIFVRLVLVFLFYPILKLRGFKFSLKEILFIGFSGLKGSLGISLSLLVQSNFASAENFFFFYAVVASLTLLINATTAGLLIRYLGLIESEGVQRSPEMSYALRQIKRNIRETVHKEIESIQNELGDYNTDDVNKLCRILRGSHDLGDVVYSTSTEEVRARTSLGKIGNDSSFVATRASFTLPAGISFSRDLLEFVRMTFLDTLKARYWDSIYSGKLGNHAFSAKLLLYSVDVARDFIGDSDLGLVDWECVESGLQLNPFLIKLFVLIDDIFSCCGFFPGFKSYLEAKRERVIIYTLLNFIDAHQYAQTKIYEFLGGFDSDGSAFVEVSIVQKYSADQVERAKEMLSKIPQNDVKSFCTSRAAKIVIIKQMEVVDKLIKVGTLSKKSAKLIYKVIENDSTQVNMEHSEIHRSFLKNALTRKREEDIELRKSFRSSQSSMLPEDANLGFRPSQFIASFANMRGSFSSSPPDRSSIIHRTQFVQNPMSSELNEQQSNDLDIESAEITEAVETKSTHSE